MHDSQTGTNGSDSDHHLPQQNSGPPSKFCRYKFKNGNCKCNKAWVQEGFGLLSWCELILDCKEDGIIVLGWCPSTW